MQAEGTAIVTGAGRGSGGPLPSNSPVEASGSWQARGTRRRRAIPDRDRTSRTCSTRRPLPGALAVPMDTCVLVNNAGLRLQYLAVEEVPVEEAQEIFEVNFHGVLRMVQQVVPAMRRNGGGVVCSITSTAVLSAMPFHGVYRASKAAVSSLSETLRLDSLRSGFGD